MSRILIILALFLATKTGLCQPPSHIGTWHYSDAATTTSVYLRKDGVIFIHKGAKDGVILAENLKKGTYELKDNLLTIKWADNSVEKRKLEFIDKDNFRLSTIGNEGSKKSESLVYTRFIVDGTVEVRKIDDYH